MGILRYNFHSEVLGLYTDVTVTFPSDKYTYSADAVLPDAGTQRPPRVYRPRMRFPTVYVLHGGGMDDSTTYRYTRLEQYADDAGVMTVCARVNDSFFLDTEYGLNYFTHVTEEIPAVIQALFASSPRREDNFVVGYAMGGSAALAVGLRCPERFAAAVDLSGGIGYTLDRAEGVGQLERIPMPKLRSAFPPADQYEGSDADLYAIAQRAAAGGVPLPELWLGVGETDFIRHRVEADHKALEALKIPHHYEVAPGLGHDWDFWDLYLKKALLEWLPIQR